MNAEGPAKKRKWGKMETIIIVTVLLIAFGWTMVPIAIDNYRTSKLLEDGVAGAGKIIEVIDTGDRLNKDPIVRVRLAVRGVDRKEFSADVRTVASAVRLQTLRPGAEVAVRYDPKDPSRVAIDDRPGATIPR